MIIIYFCLTTLGLLYILINESFTDLDEAILNKIFADKWYIILPDTGIILVCSILLITAILLKIFKCVGFVSNMREI